VQDHLAGRLLTEDRDPAGGAPGAERVAMYRVKHRELDVTQRLAGSHRPRLRARVGGRRLEAGELGVMARPERLDPSEGLPMRRDLGVNPLLRAVDQSGEPCRGRSVGILQVAVVQLLDLGEREPQRAHLHHGAHAPERRLVVQAVVGLAAARAAFEINQVTRLKWGIVERAIARKPHRGTEPPGR
jgi:hypothetical protein